MKIIVIIIGILLYQKHIKNMIVGVIVDYYFLNWFFLEEIIFTISSSLDVFIIVIVMSLFLFNNTFYIVLSIVAGVALLYASINNAVDNHRIIIKESIIHLIIEYYYYLLLGNHYEVIFNQIQGNLLVDWIHKENGGLISKLEKLSHIINDQAFNYLIIIIQKTEFYNSESILLEVEYLINDAMKELYDLRSEKAEKTNETLLLPMAIHLINMIMMIVFPYMTNLF
ncbi:MAG: hypothetical protein KAH05_02635 [Clostridiales bacterium]|nr:hypothetical protein [Clostridiales bacterium]